MVGDLAEVEGRSAGLADNLGAPLGERSSEATSRALGP